MIFYQFRFTFSLIHFGCAWWSAERGAWRWCWWTISRKYAQIYGRACSVHAYGLSRKLRFFFFFGLLCNVWWYRGIFGGAAGRAMRVCILFRIYRLPPTQTMCQSIKLWCRWCDDKINRTPIASCSIRAQFFLPLFFPMRVYSSPRYGCEHEAH